jgi:hypothetical protein
MRLMACRLAINYIGIVRLICSAAQNVKFLHVNVERLFYQTLVLFRVNRKRKGRASAG